MDDRRRAKYPPNWEALCALVVARAGNRCEGSPQYEECRVENAATHPVTGAKVVLTVAHIFENDTMTQDIERLALNCQLCHMSRDREMHHRHARVTRMAQERNPYDKKKQYDKWRDWEEQRCYQTDSSYGTDLMPGWWIAIVTHDPRAGCCVGQIQDVTERGVRLTLFDWLVGAATGNDFFVPWGQIALSFVATPLHSLRLFLESCMRYQERYRPVPDPMRPDAEAASDGASRAGFVPPKDLVSAEEGEDAGSTAELPF